MSIGKEIGRKLSVAALGWDKEEILKLVLSNTEEKHHLARFVGSVNGLKPYKIREGERAGEAAYGLLGAFEGTSSTGEVLDGSVLYLPGYVNDAIVAVFSASDDIASIKIAMDVYASYDKTAATSYVFSVHDLLNVSNQSVDEVKAEIKALPMPKKTPALGAPKA